MSYGSYELAYSGNTNLHIEVAILQKDVKASNPKTAPFTIPAIMTDNYNGTKYINNHNIINKDRIGSISNSSIDVDSKVDLFIPKEYTKWYGSVIVPKGTKFIVAFIGGDVSSIRIIGRYDKATSDNLEDYVYTLPTATRKRLGGVIIGDGINVSDDGTISSASKPIPEETIDKIVKGILGDKKISKQISDQIDEIFK